MKKTTTLIITSTLTAILVLLVFSGFTPNQQKHKANSFLLNQDQTFREKGPQYYDGMITIKVKEHVGKIAKQKGKITFNINSLDQLAKKFQINSLENRFKYNPAKLRSDLPDLSRIYRISFPEEMDLNHIAEAFNQNPNIEYAEPIPIDYPLEVPDDPDYSQQQHLPQVMAEEAWEIHKGEDGTEEIVVAIIDTGVDWEHEDLSDNCWQNMGEDFDGDGVTLEYNGSEWILDPDDLNGIDDDGNGYLDDLIGWNFFQWATNGNGSDPGAILDPSSPYYGHGTHVAGISAGSTNNSTGVASISWNVKYMPVGVANAAAMVSWGYDGIIYAAEMGADVINNSWGGPLFSQTAQEVIEYATGLGSIVVCAAGNDWDNLMFYPCSYPGAMSVASVSQNDVKTLYSNFGANVDISAPGGGWEGGILSTIPLNQYEWFYGTSMASPMVAGLLALVKSYHPEWTSNQVIAQVTYTADNIDTLNPKYEHLLGSGRINAYQALLQEMITIPQELEFGMINHNVIDNDGNKILEPGDSVFINFVIRNFNPFNGDEDVEFTLHTDDPEIELFSNFFETNVDPDGTITIQNIMGFVISEDAQNHISTLTLSAQSNIPIVAGQQFILELPIAPSGILIYDAKDIDRDMSGLYMQQFFQQIGLEVTHVNQLPESLIGYEAVFVSLENPGRNRDQPHMNNQHLSILRKYLIYGGNLYVESGGFFLGMLYVFPNYSSSMSSYFGVQSVNWPIAVNQVNNLSGMPGTIMEDLAFSTSHQLYNFSMDALGISSNGTCPFYEYGYGNVSVYREGANHKAYYQGYSLSELEDVDKTSSRYTLLMRVLDFFNVEIPEDYLASNFKAENRIGAAPLEVSFSDLSQLDENVEITSWAWDFDGDGNIDSNEENPDYTYENPGHYDVMLIVSSDNESDTLIQEDYVQVNSGVLVFEMREGHRNFSGTFIYDFLIENGIEASYTSTYPISFLGYDAIFISQGIYTYLSSTTPDGIVEPLKAYMNSGGNVYLEGGDALGRDLNTYPVSNILPYFGLNAAGDGFYNPLNNLVGVEGSITEGMQFENSNQPIYGNQDIYIPNSNGQKAFLEDGVFSVAVQHEGNQHKTFCFSYALAELADNDNGTREELLTAILNFFGIFISGQEEIPIEDNNLIIYPNPCSGAAQLKYTIEDKGLTIIEVFTISGTKIRELMNEEKMPGTYEMEIDLIDLPSGVYYCVLKTNAGAQTLKIIKL